ncbi:hypothetical protein AN642_01070 [Epulopiscium sp. SCG-B10WGA-EpuloA2]|nr:hypothetical protein AN642_01070 [Epulopiscium sp. SCG-B10WGA-EpuloA2]
MLKEISLDRIDTLISEIARARNNTDADYKSAYALAKLFIEEAQKIGNIKDIDEVLEVFPESNYKEKLELIANKTNNKINIIIN